MNMNNLIKLRQELGLTQEEMGKIIGVKRTTYSDYENYHIIIPLERLNKISNKYNLSLDYLIGIASKNDTNFQHINIDNKKIGNRLKSIRLSYNMSLGQFAKKLKVSKTILSYYENNKVKITILVLIDYYNITGKSIDWLCCKK